MAPRGLFLVRMDVAHDHEARFNEVYDKEHLPLLRAVPGVIRASRYRQPSRATWPPTSSRASRCSRAPSGSRPGRPGAGRARSGRTP